MPGAERPLRTSMVLAYGVPVGAVSSTYLLIQIYLLNFGTDVLLMPPATIGFILGAARIWDALSDPLMGSISDRTRTRFGRRRPWMLTATPFYVLAFALLWSPPEAAIGATLSAWVLFSLLACTTAVTAFMIPHLALGAELSDDYHARNWIFGVRSMAWGLGMLVAFIFVQVISTAPDPRAAASRLAMLIGAPVVLLLWIPPVFVRERKDIPKRRPMAPFRAMKDVFRNRHARRLVLVWGIDQIGFSAAIVMAPFFMIYILQRPDLVGIVPLAFFLAANLTMPLWVKAAHRFGKRDTWLFSMLLSAIGFGGTAFVGANDVALEVAMLVIAGLGSGCSTVLGPSILADVIDADELETGERKEGAYAAAWAFVIKAAGASMAALAGVALDLSGFVAGRELAPTADATMRALACGLPAIVFTVGAYLFRSFALNADEHGRIQELLRERRADTTSSGSGIEADR